MNVYADHHIRLQRSMPSFLLSHHFGGNQLPLDNTIYNRFIDGRVQFSIKIPSRFLLRALSIY